jgi:hypothetical protein
MIWLCHQVIAFVASIVALFVLSAAGVNGSLQPLLACLICVPCGYLIPRSESSSRAALLVCVIPSLVFLAAFLTDAIHFGRAMAFASYFAVHPTDNDTLGTVFFTFPAASAIAYSIGALVRVLWRRS